MFRVIQSGRHFVFPTFDLYTRICLMRWFLMCMLDIFLETLWADRFTTHRTSFFLRLFFSPLLLRLGLPPFLIPTSSVNSIQHLFSNYFEFVNCERMARVLVILPPRVYKVSPLVTQHPVTQRTFYDHRPLINLFNPIRGERGSNEKRIYVLLRVYGHRICEIKKQMPSRRELFAILLRRRALP